MSRYDNATELRLFCWTCPELAYSSEIVYCTVGVVLMTFLIGFLVRVAPFHLNFRAIIIDFCIGYVCSSLVRIVICVFYLQRSHLDEVSDNPRWIEVLQTVRNIFIYGNGLDLFAAYLERLIASRHADRYELNRRYELPIGLLAVKHALAISLIVLYSLHYINIMTPSYFLTALNIVTVVGFIRLRFLNHARYKADKRPNSMNATLSHRYQLVENIRSYRFLIPVSTVVMLGSCAGILMYFSMHYINNALFRAVMGEAFNLMISGGAMVVPLIAIIGYRWLCTTRTGIFKVSWSKKRFCSIWTEPAVVKDDQASSKLRIHNVNGDNLVVNSQEMSFVYFTQLQQQWN